MERFMNTEFNRKEVSELLAKCHRRCCICHRFCGTKIETDHIDQIAEGGGGNIENAIPVCFECHAEIHSYNIKHPRGRKFQPEELREHKKQWLKICEEKPEIFIAAGWDSDVGPLQALIDELEFNQVVAQKTIRGEMGCLFQEKQFQRAINEGSISILIDDLKMLILEAYAVIGHTNQLKIAHLNQTHVDYKRDAYNKADLAARDAEQKINAAKSKLLEFLSTHTE